MTKIISLGFSCQSRCFVDGLSADSRTMPFDWNITTKDFVLREIQKFDGSGFRKDFSELETYRMTKLGSAGLGKDGIWFWHHFPRTESGLELRPDSSQTHNTLPSKYQYLWERFAGALASSSERKKLIISNTQINLDEFASSDVDFKAKFSLDAAFCNQLRLALDSHGVQNYEIVVLVRTIEDYIDICNAADHRNLDARFVGPLDLPFHATLLAALANPNNSEAPIDRLYGTYDVGGEANIELVPAPFSSAVILSADKRPLGVLRAFSNGYYCCIIGEANAVHRCVSDGKQILFDDKTRWTKVG